LLGFRNQTAPSFGDIIVSVNDIKIYETNQFYSILQSMKEGDTLALDCLRFKPQTGNDNNEAPKVESLKVNVILSEIRIAPSS
jgi:hypothetical protein